MGNLFHELKRRKVFRVAAVYAIVAWLIIQVAGEILPTFDAPQWVNQTIVLVLILGFPLALVLSWAFDITPEGIRSDSAAIHLETAEHATDRKLTYAILVLVLLVAGFQVSDQFLLGGSESREVSPQGPENSGSVQIIRSDLYLGDIERRVIVAMRDDVAMSPDGTLLAYTGQIDGNISVYVRDLTSTDSPTLVAGEAQNFYPIAPVFSPSGENILFTRFQFNEIHSVSADGSRTQLITELAHTSVGANWFSDEEIVFTHNVERN